VELWTDVMPGRPPGRITKNDIVQNITARLFTGARMHYGAIRVGAA